MRYNFNKPVLKNVIKRAFGEVNNTFQDEFNKILFQQSTNVRFFLLAHLSTECSVSYCDHSLSVVVSPSVHNLLVNTSIYKYKPIFTKLGQNVDDHKSSDESYNGTNQTRTVRVVCP